jgi:tartrate-resistant acid phosphatase type 5
MVIRTAAALSLLWSGAAAQSVHTYIGQITPTSVLIAWGSTQGGGVNTIGRDSKPLGAARVRIANRTIPAEHNWLDVTGLAPDTSYPYEIDVDGRRIGGSVVRTWPVRATRLAFFVIGDYGDASAGQRGVASAMAAELNRRAQSADPVRFVITLGDNIYASANLGYVIRGSGSDDRDWETKFFQPYQPLVDQIPFLPSPGNHDGNSSESASDLGAYLDNFFFPGNHPARWYHFDYGGLADFFALDSTDNTPSGHPAPAYAPDGEQSRWLAQVLPASRAPWKIPYFHHPLFNAGPGHGASYAVLRHWLDLFEKAGVRAVFAGHEHNYQYSEASELTGYARYFVSGAGGELRAGNVLANMAHAHIEGWAAVRHFLLVEIDGRAMRVTPMSNEKIVVRNAAGQPLPLSVEIKL